MTVRMPRKELALKSKLPLKLHKKKSSGPKKTTAMLKKHSMQSTKRLELDKSLTTRRNFSNKELIFSIWFKVMLNSFKTLLIP
jgi:hypothetical protein